jgi:prevent-host-death family protein
MFDLSRDIESLSNFKRKTAHFIQQLKETGQPVVLTINGRAQLVVQDAAAYQRMLELKERWETVEAIREGLAEMHAGEGRDAAEFFAEMEREIRTPATP